MRRLRRHAAFQPARFGTSGPADFPPPHRRSASVPTDHRFLLGSDGRVRSDADFIFCNQPAAPDGSVQHTGKSPAGSTTSEAIDLALDTVAVDVDRNRRCGWPAGVLSAGAHCWASHLSKVISPQLGARTRHQRPLADPRPGVAGLLVGDHLARVALRREGLAHQLIQPELLRTADLTDPVQRLPTATRPTPAATSSEAIGWIRTGGRRTSPSTVPRSARDSTNSKNWVACTIEYGRPDSRIRFSWTIFARK
jgi:hypothetical protein